MPVIVFDAPTLARAVGPHRRIPTPYTETELALAREIAEGKTDREIARELFKSYNTVHGQISDLLAKTGARTRAQLIAHLMRTGRLK